MADVKWIKMTTDMFDNRKIKHLRRLPEGNNIVLIWVMLLAMAGRCNAGGWIYLTEDIPYTPKMLANELGFEESTVQLALRALEQLGMIVFKDDYFVIAGWEEHQNIESLEQVRRIKEQNRLRKQKQREREKLLIEEKKPCEAVTLDAEQDDYFDDEDTEIIEIEDTEEISESQGISDIEGSDNVVTIMSRDSHVKSRIQNKNKKENKNNIVISNDITRQTQDVRRCIEAWNELERYGIGIVKKVSSRSKRYKSLVARINEYGVDEVIKAIDNIKHSDFLQGKGKGEWVITFNWFVLPNNFPKVLEGNYKNKGTGKGADDYESGSSVKLW